ncbi:MAG: MFS transporter [Vicinamibacterales bacterium]
MARIGERTERDRLAALPTGAAIAVAALAVALESYDLTIYGLFALPIAKAFFPAQDATTSLLLSVGTLGVAYVVRPIGGLVLGAYADRAGRKAAISLTVLLMSVSTGGIGLVPAYATIGILAPWLVVAARLIQGFSAGGAIAGTVAFLAEAAPADRRGFYASWQQACQVGAFLFSVVIAALITNLASSSALDTWAWRVPFLLALAFGPLGVFIKNRLADPELYARAKARGAAPTTGRAILDNRRAVVVGFGITCLWNVTAFVLLFYMPTYAQRELGMSAGDAFLASTVSGLVLFACCPPIGLLADRVGRRVPMIVAALLLVVTSYPLFAFVHGAPTLAHLTAVECVLAVWIAGYTAPAPAMLAELFPTRSRSTGLSVAYNLSILLAGAFGPFIVTWLISTTGNPLAPAFYVAAGASISALAVAATRDRTAERLQD